MCGEVLGGHVVAVNQGRLIGGQPLIRDGLPMHSACAVDAYEACPGLRRQEAAGLLHYWRVTSWDYAPVLLARIPPEKGGEEAVNRLIARTPGQCLYNGPDLLLRTASRVALDQLRRWATAS